MHNHQPPGSGHVIEKLFSGSYRTLCGIISFSYLHIIVNGVAGKIPHVPRARIERLNHVLDRVATP